MEMGKLTWSRKRLIFGTGVVFLLLLGTVFGTGVSTMVNAHGGDTSLIHGCVNTTSGDLRLVAGLGLGNPNNNCSGFGGNWVPIDLDDDWSGAGTGSMFVSSLGDNVGIGTTNPRGKLDVAGRIFFQGGYNPSGGGGLNQGLSDNDPAFFLPTFTGVEDSDLRLYVMDNDNDRFSIWGDSCGGGACGSIDASSLAHYFDASGNTYHAGNVGIGTTTTVAKLEVVGRVKAAEGFSGGYRAGEYAALFQDFANNTILWNDPAGGGAVWLIPNPGQGVIIAQDLATLNAGTGAHWVGFDTSDGSLYFNERGSDADVRIFRPATSTLAFQTGLSERVRIDAGGNVGIGTTDPQSKLQIDGGNINVLVSSNANLTLQGDDSTPGNSNASLNFINRSKPNGGSWWHMTHRAGNENIEFHYRPQGFPSDSLPPAVPLVLTPTGNVGIGTTTPQSALQVSGYTQLDLTTGAPPAADCDQASERGRMKVDSAAGLLYICVDSGWVAK